MWTQFWDMHSGGGCKEPPYEKIYIEAPEDEAAVIFYNRFGHNPHRVTCTCCGNDYSLDEDESLEQLTAYHRDCDFAYFNATGDEVPQSEAWRPGKGHLPGCSSRYVERQKSGSYAKYRTLEEYERDGSVLIIREADIKPEERKGSIPNQGYVWVE